MANCLWPAGLYFVYQLSNHSGLVAGDQVRLLDRMGHDLALRSFIWQQASQMMRHDGPFGSVSI
jgi:hypothetical protein